MSRKKQHLRKTPQRKGEKMTTFSQPTAVWAETGSEFKIRPGQIIQVGYSRL